MDLGLIPTLTLPQGIVNMNKLPCMEDRSCSAFIIIDDTNSLALAAEFLRLGAEYKQQLITVIPTYTPYLGQLFIGYI